MHKRGEWFHSMPPKLPNRTEPNHCCNQAIALKSSAPGKMREIGIYRQQRAEDQAARAFWDGHALPSRRGALRLGNR